MSNTKRVLLSATVFIAQSFQMVISCPVGKHWSARVIQVRSGEIISEKNYDPGQRFVTYAGGLSCQVSEVVFDRAVTEGKSAIYSHHEHIEIECFYKSGERVSETANFNVVKGSGSENINPASFTLSSATGSDHFMVRLSCR